MKLFGFNITRDKKKLLVEENPSVIQELVSQEKPSDPEKDAIATPIPISKIPPVTTNALSYSQSFAGGRGYFISSDYDLAEIGKVIDTESYVRQAFIKKHGLMFKEGWGLYGANKNTIRYIKVRMAQIARASSIPTSELLRRIGASLISTSNAFLVKVRRKEASGGAIRKTFSGKKLQPVAGYFPAAPETILDIDYILCFWIFWNRDRFSIESCAIFIICNTICLK